MRPVSIVVPVTRPEGARRCFAACHENSGLPKDMYEIVTEEDPERIGLTIMLKRLVEQSSYDLVCFLGDDCVPLPDFLLKAVLAMETLPDGWGLVGLNDQFHGPELATHWLADKRLLPFLGGEFFHTGYRAMYCDNELTERCRAMGRYVWAEEAKIFHDHPAVTGRPLDLSEYPGFAQSVAWKDRFLFHRRRRNRWNG